MTVRRQRPRPRTNPSWAGVSSSARRAWDRHRPRSASATSRELLAIAEREVDSALAVLGAPKTRQGELAAELVSEARAYTLAELDGRKHSGTYGDAGAYGAVSCLRAALSILRQSAASHRVLETSARLEAVAIPALIAASPEDALLWLRGVPAPPPRNNPPRRRGF